MEKQLVVTATASGTQSEMSDDYQAERQSSVVLPGAGRAN
jgi:hypothetical protein